MTKNGDIVYIAISKYKALLNPSYTGPYCYEGSQNFDSNCGLRFIARDNEKYGSYVIAHSFAFVVVDEKKFLLANLKYNLNDN